MSEPDLKALAEAGVSALDVAQGQSTYTAGTEDWTAEQLQQFAKYVIEAGKTSRVEVIGIRAGGTTAQKLGINPSVGTGRFGDVLVAPNDNWDEIVFVFRTRK